jgi:ankyrin repeat protein
MDVTHEEQVDTQEMRIEELEEKIRLLTLENIELKRNVLTSKISCDQDNIEEFSRTNATGNNVDQKVDEYFRMITSSEEINRVDDKVNFLMNHLINGILTMRLLIKQKNNSSLIIKIFAKVMETIAKDIGNFTNLPNSFPVAWLLQQYPLINSFQNDDDLSWISHIQHWFFLSCSSTYDGSNYNLDELFDPKAIYNSICSKSNDEMSPFNILCGIDDPNEELVADFLSKYPNAAKQQSAIDGTIPIFHAVANNNSIDCVKLLSQYSQDVIQIEDNFGFNILNYACYSGQYHVCKFLFERFPYIPQPTFPLLNDAAVNKKAGIELIKLVFEKYPSSLSTCDEFGAYPIHLAAEFNRLDVVKYLIELNPTSVYLTDEESLLPLHYAAKRKDKDLTIVDYLVSLNPQGVDLNEYLRQSTSGSAVKTASNIFNKIIDGIKAKNTPTVAVNQFPVVVTPSIVTTENKPVKRTSIIGQKRRNSSMHTRDVLDGVSLNRNVESNV